MINETDLKQGILWYADNIIQRWKRGLVGGAEAGAKIDALQSVLHSFDIMVGNMEEIGQIEHPSVEGCDYDNSYKYRGFIVHHYFDDYGQQDFYKIDGYGVELEFGGGAYNLFAESALCVYLDDYILYHLLFTNNGYFDHFE